MFGLSTSHLLIMGIIVLLFGSKRLPELGASMGKAFRAFKNATDGRFVEDLVSGDTEQIVADQGAKQGATKT